MQSHLLSVLGLLNLQCPMFFWNTKISMQDKTDAGFSSGQDILNEGSEDAVTLFFTEGGKYFIAIVCWPGRIWRFVFQDFDPEDVRD